MNLEQVANGYFKLTAQPSGKVFGVNDKTASIEMQESNGDETQQWDVIPTGEKGYFRIKTRSRAAGHVDYMFLQVTDDETPQVNLGKRNEATLGQQWRFV
jgi:hypothetical protein